MTSTDQLDLASLEEMVLDYQRVSLSWHGHGGESEALTVGSALKILTPIANQSTYPLLAKQALSLVYKIVYGPHAEPNSGYRRMRR